MKALQNRTNRAGWGFVLPGAVLILLFGFYPMVASFVTSLQTGRGAQLTFSGFDNYARLFSDPVFLQAVGNTLLYLVFQVPIMIILALVFATLLNRPAQPCKGFLRTAIFLPCVTSLVAYSVLFKSIFANDGLLNSVLQSTGLIDSYIPWLQHPVWAKVTVILAITWRWTGYNMIFYLAALQNIDPSIYEAAKLDGAGSVSIFFRITVPLLKPIILFTTIMSTNGTLQLFDETVNLTGGGPANSTLSISQYIYNLCFRYTPEFGYAATVAYSIVVMVLALSALQFLLARDRDKPRARKAHAKEAMETA